MGEIKSFKERGREKERDTICIKCYSRERREKVIQQNVSSNLYLLISRTSMVRAFNFVSFAFICLKNRNQKYPQTQFAILKENLLLTVESSRWMHDVVIQCAKYVFGVHNVLKWCNKIYRTVLFIQIKTCLRDQI